MPTVFGVTTRGLPRLPKRYQNALIAKTMRGMAFGWWARYRPGHFTKAGARKYNYGKRHTKDVRRGRVKRTRGGRPRAPSGLPLVWSGRSLGLSQQKRLKGTPKKSHVTMPVRAFNFRPPKNPQLNMRKEFTTVLTAERKNLERKGAKDLEQRLAKHRVQSRVTIRG
jgi:hypothetical protein